MTTFERLQRKIKKQFGYELYGFRRTYAKTLSLSLGGASWEAYMKIGSTHIIVSSIYSATELLKAKKLSFSGMEFYPNKDGDQ
ncbi:MAG: hypothetical protein J6T99_11005 [Oscillospiraceae bacterium]|nr:hypothetical protein [Oscillospiraceae bacterium]